MKIITLVLFSLTLSAIAQTTTSPKQQTLGWNAADPKAPVVTSDQAEAKMRWHQQNAAAALDKLQTNPDYIQWMNEKNNADRAKNLHEVLRQKENEERKLKELKEQEAKDKPKQ